MAVRETSIKTTQAGTSSNFTESPFRQNNQLFFWRGQWQKYHSEFTKIRHFEWKKIFFFLSLLVMGPHSHAVQHFPLTPTSYQAFWASPLSLRNSSHIYATGLMLSYYICRCYRSCWIKTDMRKITVTDTHTHTHGPNVLYEFYWSAVN